MAMDQKLGLKQTQKMALTPQMQQSIKILQLSMADLVPYINQEVEQNPFLDGGDPDTPGFEAEEGGRSEENSSLADGPSEAIIDDSPGDGWSDEVTSTAVYESSDDKLTYSNVGSGGSSGFGGSEYSIDQNSESPVSLREHILDQANVEIIDPAGRMIAAHLTDSLDENGYIDGNFKDLAELLQCEIQQIEEILAIMQRFEPAGIFARNLAECLALQLKDKDRFDPAMELFIDNLGLMARCEFKKLQKICEVSEEDLRDMCEEIKALNPKPARDFVSEVVESIQPDVYLIKSPDGQGWRLELNSDALPRVLVNRSYYSEIAPQVKDENSKKFVTEQMNTANWLVKALDQRANTILKVATEIVDQQEEFFKKGIRHLKPMVLSDIATAIDMHESTISRVINGKFMATHMGLYELKYFFSSHVGSMGNSGEDISSKTVKHLIKELIDKEKVSSILSDDKITSLLKAQGVNVARRTVMKYREAMQIPSSVQRRREKKMKEQSGS